MMKVLALCDVPSPVLTSGFARVAQNLFTRWAKWGATIDVWGIAFSGFGYKKAPFLNEIFPAGGGGEWQHPDRLDIFLSQLATGGYTHVWLMQDTFFLSANGFPQALKNVCTAKKIRSMLYFPVDAPLKPEWTEIIAAVDCAVAYTRFGAMEAIEKHERHWPNYLKAITPPTTDLPVALPEFRPLSCEVLPHGVDTTVYHPISDRLVEREKFWEKPWAGPDDFLMVNVNSHQRRKDVPRSLELLKAVKDLGVPAKLLLHMSAISDIDVNLEVVGAQLGLKVFEDWGHHSQVFVRGQSAFPETPTAAQPNSLLQIYNIADLYLTTTLGEGWGLGITEALACGTPVAMPNHTSCAEIGDFIARNGMANSRVMLPLERGGIVLEGDNSRVRTRVDLAASAQAIKDYYDSGAWRLRQGLTQPVREWLDWNRIARRMLQLLKGK